MTNPGTSFVTTRRPKAVTIDPGAVGAAATLDVTATVAGLRVGAPVLVWAASLEDNLSISNAHCSAAGTVKFRLLNPTAASIDPASQTFMVVQL
jgi:hypothetical protein